MKVVYVAGPYRADNAWLVEQNIRKAEAVAFALWEQGVVAMCPHTMTRFYDGTLTDKIWLEGTLEMMRRCDVIVLCTGWHESTGSIGECNEAMRLGMPVFDLEKVSEWARLKDWIDNDRPE